MYLYGQRFLCFNQSLIMLERGRTIMSDTALAYLMLTIKVSGLGDHVGRIHCNLRAGVIAKKIS